MAVLCSEDLPQTAETPLTLLDAAVERHQREAGDGGRFLDGHLGGGDYRRIGKTPASLYPVKWRDGACGTPDASTAVQSPQQSR